MAAHLQPTDDQIDQVLMLLGIARDEAIQRLKGNNNNVEQAVNEYYDNPNGGNKYRWDETQFSNDQDGYSNNQGICEEGIKISEYLRELNEFEAFDIHAPDDHGPFGPRFDGVGAPSRPPSRTSHNKSPLGKIIDLTAEHAAANPSMSTNHDYDTEMQQALAASAAEAGIAPQETGITGTDQVYFGPATRQQNEYEQGQWAMVPLGKSAVQEILLDPEPAQRMRGEDIPAFLKPSVKNHRVGALLTIFHEIPVTRGLFLNTPDSDMHYGYDREWWTGKPIEPAENQPLKDTTADRELQRLMAFLDKTERSYGSVEALLNHPDIVKEMRRISNESPEAAVLEVWRKELEDSNPGMVRQIYSTGVDSEREETSKEFAILEMCLPPKDSMQETIYDIADEVLWRELQPLELADSPYLSRIAEVFTFKIDGGDETKSIEVPLEWYPDRYLQTGRQAALDMRINKLQIQEELHRMTRLEDRLAHAALRTGKIVKVQDLFKASLKHDESEIKEEEEGHDDDMLSEQGPSPAAEKISTELSKVVANIDKKLQALNVEKEKARQTFRELSKLYTEQSREPDAPKLKRYTLRGVSTTKSTMYICRRAEGDLIDMETDDGQPKGHIDQWWRINYASWGENPVTVEKTTTEKVLEAAKSDSKNTLLVYASEKAMDHPHIALPKSLETFVKWDNSSFKKELTDAEAPQTVGASSQVVGPSSPSKRKWHESSLHDQENHGVQVSERELPGEIWNGDAGPSSMNDTFAPNGNDKHEVIVGIDPSLLMKQDNYSGQEMQERTGIPMLSGRPMGKEKEATIDSMDLDHVVEDADVVGESAAVKRVGFADQR
ncbi:uncharacterized protein PAC_09969 [Phialocephala subalpina]|uniref:UBA domain-containing protein n=1 Tax=Phialocephala subalpina TaxID=576137 RepID=A0A1L7X4Y7_9HELO|nr:uncharacterized protein PAC_09969 [Phialocephala subalpina]